VIRPTVAFLLPDLAGGGAQRVMLTLLRHLDRSRFTPRLMVLGTIDTLLDTVAADVPLDRANASRVRQGLPWLVRQIRSVRPDIIVSTLGYTNLSLLAIKPLLPAQTRLVVREANTPDATIRQLPGLVPARQLYRSLYPRAARVIAQTETIAVALTELAPGVASRLRLLPNPVDVAQLRARASTPLREEGPGLRLVAAGRLTHQKGFDRLIHFMRRLSPGTRLAIHGEGPDRASLEQQIKGHGLESRVRLTGFTPDLPAHLAGADALVMPSRWEGLPNVALEALAVGTPVVGSRDAALSGIADAHSRAVVVADSDEDFIRALADRPISAEKVAVLRDSLLPAHYDVSVIIERFQQILTEALLHDH
jgi:glycosyltransferase involved in cell wall biosynthesis